MSDGMIALIVVGSILAYFVCLGICWQLTDDWDDVGLHFWASVVWPITLSCLFGCAIVKLAKAPSKAKLPDMRIVK